jgi:Tol biopolymer transport system component
MAKIGIRTVALAFMVSLLCIPAILLFGQYRAAPILTYIAEDTTRNADIFFFDTGTYQRHNFTQSPPLDEWSFLWSHDGQQIIYTVQMAGGDLLSLMDANGRNQRLVDITTLQAFNLTWSADGQSLTYFSSYQNTSDLYIISLSDNTAMKLTDTPLESETFPDWSPRGADLLFFMHGDMFLADMQRGTLERLTDTPMAEEYPVWSPDGSKIAYYLTDRRSGQRELYVITIANRQVQPLETVIPPRALPVSWSPDSRALTLTLENQQIITLDIASGAIQALTDGSQRTWGSVWSPDGRLIAYIENRQLRIYDVHSMNTLPLDFEVQGLSSLVWKP